MRRTLIALLFLAPLNFCFAEPTIPINLSIQTYDSSLFDSSVDVSPCADSNTASTTSINALCATEQAASSKNWPINLTWYSFGASLDSLSTYSADFTNNRYWLYFINGEPGDVAMNSYLLKSGDKLLLVYGISPLRLSASSTNVSVDSPVNLSAEYFDFDAWHWSGAGAVDFYVNGAFSTSTSSGTYDFTPPNPGTYIIAGKKTGYLDGSLAINVSSGATASVPPPSFAGGGCTVCGKLEDLKPTPPPVFDMDKAEAFLIANRAPDGSFGSEILTDWAAIALSSVDSAVADSLRMYYVAHPLKSNLLTDIERHAMAMLSLNLNPYAADGTDYISSIRQSFNNGQFGDPKLFNDDIFAVIVLRRAGVLATDTEIQAAEDFILSAQAANGGWQSPDITAAALEAFSLLEDSPKISTAREKALNYLKDTEFDDGGYANTFTASWVVQGLLASGADPSDWKKNNNNPDSFLIDNQGEDGGMKTAKNDRDSRIWATAYAIPAMAKKTLPDSLHSFPLPESFADDLAQGTSSADVLAVVKTEPTASSSSLKKEEQPQLAPVLSLAKSDIKNESTAGENVAAVAEAADHKQAGGFWQSAVSFAGELFKAIFFLPN